MNDELSFSQETDLDLDELQPLLIGPYGENRVPLAIEFIFTITRIITVFAAVGVTIFSLLAHVSWLMLTLRLVVTISVIGLFGYLVSWLVGKYYLQAAYAELEEIEQKVREQMENRSEVEYSA